MQYGFQGAIHCTPATGELIEMMLMDSAHIQEEDAACANKKGFSKHHPAEPLYTSIDALQALRLVTPSPFDKWVKLSAEVRFRFINSGHILGAAFVEFRIREKKRGTTSTPTRSPSSSAAMWVVTMCRCTGPRPVARLRRAGRRIDLR